MNILIVDDHAANQQVLRVQLEAEGHTVVDAADGVEALGVLETVAVDAVISDALMPNMDGFRLCLEIRKSARFAALPFIVYTSTYNSPADRNLALEVGANFYLTKPAPVAALLEALATAQRDQARRRQRSPTQTDPTEMGVIKRYNAALVTKLEQKNSELEAANVELRANLARYHGTLDKMLEGCQIVGHDWRYLYLNDTAARHGHRTKDELLGRTMFECFPGIEHSGVFPVLRRCMTERAGARVENEFVHRDGSSSWFELSIQPVPEGIFVLSLDITEQKRDAQKVRDQLNELLRWQDVMLNREERVQALKAEVNELLVKHGQPPRYSDPEAP